MNLDDQVRGTTIEAAEAAATTEFQRKTLYFLSGGLQTRYPDVDSFFHAARKEGRLADWGPYARVRHPEHGGFLLVMIGFLIQSPTILTVVKFPFLVWLYRCLALAEEREMERLSGGEWRPYVERTPRFLAILWARTAHA